MSNREKELIENIAEVKDEVLNATARAGRKPDEVKLLAVSKLHAASDIEILYRAGHRSFGESYVQEALAKQEELSGLDIDWHFIGGLQSKKAKYVAGKFSAVHSVDSSKLAVLLNKKAESLGVVQNVFIQVNTACEGQKCGVGEEQLPAFVEEIMELENLNLKGLMALPPFFDDAEGARPYFARLRMLAEGMEKLFGIKLPELSMGMTGDYRVAIEEGSTMVRVGTKIFGQRPGYN
ncbi:YggS family pyridoxal phosphate-dependent enzyme [Maridesulfovibrio zosterae]|uniref:YggS family pyridoxal phosphate-dependent enzyme n=1 Tax=Maridesulfovibrio zosterae TaxID=82171 RepID=UPI0003FA3A3A|nr:YggS family pyridoxal phosphate-dependent enzyme [Maridesulfovibrio zosterae]